MQRREVKLGGGVIVVADDQPTFWDRVEAGRWENGTLAVIERFVHAGTTLLDLGAWVGPTTLLAARRGARVIAVESDPAALDQLHRNLAANPALAERVTVVPRAIHATAGPLTLGARRKPGDSMSSIHLADAATTWTVEAITPRELARMVDTQRLFVKIDIEGAEYDLLPALEPLIERPSAQVLVSFHPKILAASRKLEQVAVAEATRQALAIFDGWRALAVAHDGAVEAAPDASAIADGSAPEEWLFLKP